MSSDANTTTFFLEPIPRHSRSFSSFSDLADFSGEPLEESSGILYDRQGIEEHDTSISTKIYNHMRTLPTIKETSTSDDSSSDCSQLLLRTDTCSPTSIPNDTLQRRLSLVRRAIICPCSGELNITCKLPHKCINSSKICEKRCTSITRGLSPAFVRSHVRRCADEECATCAQLKEAAKKARAKLDAASKETNMDTASNDALEEVQAEGVTDMECDEDAFISEDESDVEDLGSESEGESDDDDL